MGLLFEVGLLNTHTFFFILVNFMANFTQKYLF